MPMPIAFQRLRVQESLGRGPRDRRRGDEDQRASKALAKHSAFEYP